MVIAGADGLDPANKSKFTRERVEAELNRFYSRLNVVENSMYVNVMETRVQKEVRDLSRVLAHVLSHLRNGVALIRQNPAGGGLYCDRGFGIVQHGAKIQPKAWARQ